MPNASRREFMLTGAATAVAPAPPAPVPLSICAFSKHFHWTSRLNQYARYAAPSAGMSGSCESTRVRGEDALALGVTIQFVELLCIVLPDHG